MAITSTTTLAEAKAEYLGNASYAENGSVTQAKAFVSACRALIVLLPARSMAGGKSADFSIADVRAEKEKAETWIGSNNSAAGSARVRHFDFSDIRC